MCECQSMITLGPAAFEQRRSNVRAKTDPVNDRIRRVRSPMVLRLAGARLNAPRGIQRTCRAPPSTACVPRPSSFFRSPSVAQAEPERFGHDAEYLGVVHLAANTVAAGANRGQNHVLAGMHVGVDHRR